MKQNREFSTQMQIGSYSLFSSFIILRLLNFTAASVTATTKVETKNLPPNQPINAQLTTPCAT